MLATVLLFFAVLVIILPRETEATLSCSLASSCTSPDVALLNMASTTNSHVSIGTSTDYNTNIVCCKNVSGLSSACSGTGVSRAIVNLSSTTNAHIESSSVATYPISACLHVATGGYVSSTVQLTDCSGYDVTIGSMTSTTNSHMGAAADYTYKICASAAAPPQSLSFEFSGSSDTITFGALSATNDRFANASGGSDDESTGSTIQISTNAQYGYALSVKGDTLRSGANIINPILTTSISVVGTSQFGIHVLANNGSGVALAPYVGTGDYGLGYYGFLADTTTTSRIAQATAGDGATTSYYISYLANIAPSTAPGSYSTVLTYVVTAEY